MPNLNSEPLFQLIKSLTKAEKRYFKLLVTRNKSAEDAKFLKLFDLIDKQQEYDEAKILKKESSLKPGQMSNLKAHLYKQILQSLRSHNTSGDISIHIREQIDQATVLYNKCLYKQSFKILEKAKQLAEKNERPLLLLEIIEFEKRLVTKLIEPGMESRVTSIMKESERIQDKLRSLNNFSNLSLKLYSFYMNIGFIRDHKDFEIVNSFFYSTMPNFQEDQLSFDEKTYLFSSLVGYYFFIQDDERAYEYAKKWVGMFDDNPDLISSKLEMYIRALNNLLMAQNKLFRYSEFVKSFKKFEDIPRIKNLNLTDNIKLLWFKYASTHRINQHFLLGQFDEGTKIIPEIADNLNGFMDRLDMHYILIFYYKFACMYFGNQEYRKAVFWLNKIINAKNVDLRSDIQSFARILNLICHYELENTDLVDYYILSTYRFMIKKENLYLFQRYILKFLKNLNNIKPDQLNDAFITLRNQLLPLKKNPYEKRAFNYFDIISWLESKIHNRPVQDVIGENARKRIKLIEDSDPVKS
ncbi:hypothetical protein QQ008_05000 [Fulvivirgaceae bacterium BMA10]|uniref:Uncharacterized protein n=1 Tax=Splendidivirga corallicola TaxID=3051826 RepID=A0ABT8KJ15_9BACT|nr:hypothetical protein [Fulvivirgaceae bacterium BMA10]